MKMKLAILVLAALMPLLAADAKFLAVYTLHVPIDQLTPAQMAKLQEHGAYITSQAKKGVIVWGGRSADKVNPRGYLELDVASEAAAKEFVMNDPAVKAGLFDYTLDSFDELVRTGKM